MLLGVHTYSRPHTQVEVMSHQHIFLHLSLSQVWSNSHGVVHFPHLFFLLYIQQTFVIKGIAIKTSVLSIFKALILACELCHMLRLYEQQFQISA